MSDDDLDKLIEDLEDEDEEVRNEAAEALGEIGDARAVGPLIQVMKDAVVDGDEWEICEHAAYALAAIGDESAVEPLIQIMTDAAVDERFSVLQDAADALGVIGDERAVTPLIGVLDSVPSCFVRMSAMTALGAIGDEGAVDSLIEVLGAEFDQFGRPWGYDAYSRTETDDSGVHNCAAEALENLTGGPIVKCLIDALENDNYDVRRYAAVALGKIDDVRAVEPLIKVLGDEDEDEEVHDAAKEALVTIAGRTRYEFVLGVGWRPKALGDDDRQVRDAAKEALRKLGHEVKE